MMCIVLDVPTKKFLASLRGLRKSAGFTQRELAGIMNIHCQTLKNIERGQYNPSLELLMKLAGYFGYDLTSSVNHERYSRRLSGPNTLPLPQYFRNKRSRLHILLDAPTKEFLSSLRSLRRHFGLLRSEVAEAVNIPAGTLKDYENGAVPILGNLIKLALYFGCDLSESINYKFYCKKDFLNNLRISLLRYGLTYPELSELTGYHRTTICATLHGHCDGNLQCLKAILEVLHDEQERAKQREGKSKCS